MTYSLWPHGLQHTRPPCPSQTPRVYSNLCPLSRWCHPAISSSVVPFFCLQSFPASSIHGIFQARVLEWGAIAFSIAAAASKSPHTYTETKLHPRANKFRSKTYRATSPVKQEHNPEHKNTGGQKSHQTHRHLKTHYWTLHCTPERRDPAPPTRTPMQASLTWKPWQATHLTPPIGRNLHKGEEPQTARIQKGYPKHSNLNKMKRQRSIQQVKEHDKSPPNQTKEEIGSLTGKEFRIMTVKMTQNFENKMEVQINSLETRMEKIQGKFNKDLVEIRKAVNQ